MAASSARAAIAAEVAKCGWPRPLSRAWMSQSPSSPRSGGGISSGSTRSDSSSAVSRVLQFNLLADGLSNEKCDWGGFDAVVAQDPGALLFEARKWQLLNVILEQLAPQEERNTTTAEVAAVCVQECDFFEWLSGHLGQLGWTGTFAAKEDSPCLQYSDRPDGCAIFWNANDWAVRGEPLHHTYDGQGQVLVGVHLTRKGETPDGALSELYVATTHLKATKNEKGAQIRAAEAKEAADLLAASVSPTIPIVLAGDLNAVPSEAAVSEMYRVFGSAYGRHEPSTGADLETALQSEPAFTTWKIRTGRELAAGESKHTIDYIFFRGAQCVEVLGVPADDDVPPPRLPSRLLPSDHIMIGGGFTSLGTPELGTKS
jgi:Endonuclease/Exonuclease/phosphatase family